MGKNIKGITVEIGGNTTKLGEALKSVDAKSKALQSELKQVNTALKFDPTNTVLLTQKQDLLKQTIEETKKRLEALQAAEKNTKVEDIGEEAYRELQREIEITKSRLRNYGDQLSRTSGENEKFQTETESSKDELRQLENQTKDNVTRFDKLKGAMSKIGGAAVGGFKVAGAAIGAMAAAAGAAVGAIGKLMMKTADYAGELRKQSDITGQTTERIQELTYVGKQLDVSYETIMKAQQKLTQGMNSARLGGKKQTEAFAALGVEIKNTDGSLRNSKIVMMEAFDALGKVGNETERDALSLSIFGKSAMELNPLIKAGSAEIAKYSDEAHKVGAVMSDETITALDDFGDSVEAIKMSTTAVAGTILASIAPAIQETIGKIQELAGSFAGAFKTGDYSEFSTKLTAFLTDTVGKITQFLPKLIGILAELLPALITGIVSALPQILPALANGISSIISALAEMLVRNGPALITAAINALMTIINALLDNLPLIIDAALQMVIALATGIAASLPELIPKIVDVVLKIVETLIDNLPMLIEAAIQIIMALAKGLIDALPKLIEKLPVILTKIVSTLIALAPQILKAAWELIVTLGKGIIKYIPELLKKIPEIYKQAFAELKKGFAKAKDIGSDLIKGIWNGIKDMSEWLWNKIKGFAGTVTSKIKDFFGISSPSKVFRDEVGANLAEGLALGFQDKMRSIAGRMAQAVPNAFGAAVNINATAGMLPGGSGGIVTIVHNGPLVGSGGMKELSRIISHEMAGDFRLVTGGTY
jgi:phage-related protein